MVVLNQMLSKSIQAKRKSNFSENRKIVSMAYIWTSLQGHFKEKNKLLIQCFNLLEPEMHHILYNILAMEKQKKI